MTKTVHLIVEQGEERGMRITIPPDGARLGRSSKNDVVLVDPLLSRHHCRLFFKRGEGLWITDLGSANETIVNGSAIQEARLQVDDRITIGDTVLKVVHDGTNAAAVVGGAVVDLGLTASEQREMRRPTTISRTALIIVAALMALLALAVWAPRLFKRAAPKPVVEAPAPAPLNWPVEISYEKVEATDDNIFRYELRLDDKRMLSVQIDDIKNDRHVRKEKQVDEEYIRYLAKLIEDEGFFALSDKYEGLQPGRLDSWQLTITIGRRSHTSTVINRLEPDVFRKTRELIEECGKNELGLWAIQFSPDKLVEMARNTMLLAKKLYDEREVKHGNLWAAIHSYEEADWYLETVEPKPDYYGDIVSGSSEAQELLDKLYEDQNFRAKRAVKLRQWQDAINELRIILDMIPDRSDPRHREARKELIEMENRLGMEER